MLAFDHHVPPGAGDGAPCFVLLHGRGSHRGDLQALRPHLPPDAVLVTPQAPHPGHPWGYGPGWAWYRYLAEDRVDDASLQESITALAAFLSALPDALGLRPGRLVLGGFSQGGTTSLAYGLRSPDRVDAVLNFSGFLPDTRLVPLDAARVDGLAIFWGHGLRDPNIPHVLAERGRGRLREAGIAVEARDYPIGHWITPEEVRDAIETALP